MRKEAFRSLVEIKKKTGLVGPVLVRRVEMRLHQNAARTGDDVPGGSLGLCIASRQ
jgi:hypothetical protein